eukprot:m51a1_g13601 putative protein sey1 (325) ;mRNA; f:152-1902
MIQIINGAGEFGSTPDDAPSSAQQQQQQQQQPQAASSPRHQEPTQVLGEFLCKSGFTARGKDYGVVAVLGAQSSGKSTLLNLLFDTRFRVLKADVTRERTTYGVWLGVPKRAPQGPGSLLVMDVEGTDGSARQDELSFERKSSLFTLTVSSVLIVNLWYHDIGRWQASNLGLLKTVFELNIQLFARAESPKTLILFIIRDHTATPLPKLQSIITERMEDIWASLKKPAQFADEPMTRFFDVQFTSLPHMVLQPDEFGSAIAALRDKFTCPETPGFYMRQEYRKQIPADGFALFAEQVWESIKQNKDLDIPSQKHLMATWRRWPR